MKKLIKESFKVILGLITGLIVGTLLVDADILLESTEVSVDNTKMQLKNSDNSNVTNVQEAVEALNRNLAAKECALGYYKQNAKTDLYECKILPICKAVRNTSNLHTETCRYVSSIPATFWRLLENPMAYVATNMMGTGAHYRVTGVVCANDSSVDNSRVAL